jgi:hypothetical protein
MLAMNYLRLARLLLLLVVVCILLSFLLHVLFISYNNQHLIIITTR